jgi:hypothetical protein
VAGVVSGALRVALGVLALAAVAAQWRHGIADPPFSAVNFFSFFTIESNLLAAGVLIAVGAGGLRGDPRSERLDLWRRAATLYMATTGVVYSAMLAGQDSELLGWVNLVLHFLMPLALVADWALDRPRWRIPFRRALVWIAFPAAFIGYTLIRGAATGWYPYPFVDAADRGYPAVLLTTLILGAAMLVLIWLLAWTTRLRAAPAEAEPAR